MFIKSKIVTNCRKLNFLIENTNDINDKDKKKDTDFHF